MHKFSLATLAFLTAATVAFLPVTTPVPRASAADCRYVLGFKAVHDAIPDKVGDCLDNEAYDDVGAVQHTKNGLMAWRKGDNFTAFTDGYRTWVAGPFGVQMRYNTERYEWEAYDPQLLALQLSDMPPGYSEMPPGKHYTSNEWGIKQSKDPRATTVMIQSWGRLIGYTASYWQLNATGLKSGTFAVISDHDVMQTPEGAHLAFVDSERELMIEQGAVKVSVPAIGDEAFAVQYTSQVGQGEDKVAMTVYLIAFRRGRVLSTVANVAVSQLATIDDLVGYARLIDKRIAEYPIKK